MKKIARAVIFIDGNNLYHGMQQHTHATRHLDYVHFSKNLTHGCDWCETRYYTGKVPKVGDSVLYSEHLKLLADMDNTDKVNYFLGRLERRPNKRLRPLTEWLDELWQRKDIFVSRKVYAELREIAKGAKSNYVEKAVDTMIAVDMVAMAFKDEFDVAYLVSADGDFTPAVEKVREVGKKVVVASATTAHELERIADGFIALKRDNFQAVRR